MAYLSLFILFFLFLSPQTAVEGSCYGITLWSTQLLPSLLPCFILTKLIRQACPSLADKPCYLLMGTLCGYPVGASLVASQYTQGILSQKKVYFYLGFTNMASPSFIILFCGTVSLNLSGMDSLFLFLLLTIASFLGSLIFYLLFPLKDKAPAAPCSKKAITSQSLNDIILDSFNTLFLIAGYVCLCCILCYALLQSLPVNPAVKSVLSGFIELTCGIASLPDAGISMELKKVLSLLLAGFGGLSALAQTYSILKETELSIIPYFVIKLLNGITAAFFGYILFCVL